MPDDPKHEWRQLKEWPETHFEDDPRAKRVHSYERIFVPNQSRRSLTGSAAQRCVDVADKFDLTEDT
jgi:hypothetical protein